MEIQCNNKTRYITLRYQRYISEIKKDLKSQLFNGSEKKILLISDTGSGKTTTLLKMLEEEQLKYIFCAPYTSIVAQLEEKDLKGVEALHGGAKLEDPTNSLIITYDKASILKNLDDLEERIFFKDEGHVQITSSSFRGRALEVVSRFEHLVKKDITLTATATELLLGAEIPDGNGFLDVDLPYDLVIKCTSSKKEIAEHYYLFYGSFPSKARALNSFIASILETKIEGLTDIVRVNSKQTLNFLYNILKNENYNCEILHSDNKESSRVYRSLTKDGSIDESLDFLLVTSLIDDGLSIVDSHYGNMWVFDEARTTVIKQFSSRCRKGMKTFNIFNFKIDDSNKKDVESLGFELGDNNIDEALRKYRQGYKAINELNLNLFKKGAFSRDVKEFYSLKTFSCDLDYYRVVDKVYSTKSYYLANDPALFKETIFKEYQLSFEEQPFYSEIEKEKKEAAQKDTGSMINLGRKSFFEKIKKLGMIYITAYANKYRLTFFHKVAYEKITNHIKIKEALENISVVEASLIKEYITLRNEGFKNQLSLKLIGKPSKYVNRIKDSLSYLHHRDTPEFVNSFEGNIISHIKSYVSKEGIEKYNKEEASAILNYIQEHYKEKLLINKNFIMFWMIRIYDIENCGSGKKRLTIMDEISLDSIAEHLNLKPEDLCESEVEYKINFKAA